MSSKTVKNAGPETAGTETAEPETTAPETDGKSDMPVAPNAPHPLDSWLKRELRALHGESERQTLPPGIAELAARLEERLRGTGRAPGDDPGDDKDEGPGKRPGPKPADGPEGTTNDRKR